MSSIQLPYSWYNVSTFYQNQNFRIIWPTIDASQTINYNIVLDNGFYTVNDIQNFIEQFCIANNLYLINANGDYVYYINLNYNLTAYKIQLILEPVPVSLPVGYTSPVGFPAFPTNSGGRTPRFQVLDDLFGRLIGFNVGISPPATITTVSYDKLSDYTPLGSNVNSIIVRCNVISNDVSMPSDILDSFGIPTGSNFGSNIVYEPSFQKWVTIREGTYSSTILKY